jgi:uncharacterized protein
MLMTACNRTSQQGLPVVEMKIGNKEFVLEVAATAEARNRGLMRRDSMPADHGMIFVFTEEQPLSFWMRNTRIALDIIYLDRGGRVVSIKPMKPYDESSTPSDGPAQYAIEVNQGAAATAGVKVGDVLALPAELKGQ